MRSAILTLMIALSARAVFACGLPQPRMVCQEYFAEQAVVMAKLMRVRHVQTPGQVEAHVYYMEVVKRFRGRTTNRFQVYEESGSGRAPFEWKRGENYLLFVSKDARGWELDGCGNSAPEAKAKKVLKEIDRINSGKTREFIMGDLASEEGLPAVTVKIEGEGKSYTVLSDKKNEFSMRVPPGTYAVTVGHPDWQFDKDRVSYDDPAKVTIEPGRCAQIQFQASPAATQ